MKWTQLISTLMILIAPIAAANTLDKLKALEGRWIASDGSNETEVRYELHADGTAVVEHLWGMVTVYHQDGENLMATHYCSMGNQPRMIARKADITDQDITFRFLDISNDTGRGHISGVAFRFVGDDEVVQTWTSRDDAGVDSSFSMTYRRSAPVGNIDIVTTENLQVAVETMRVVDLADVDAILAAGYPRIAAHIASQGGSITGKPMLKVVKFAEDEKIFEYGFPVNSPVTETDDIKNALLPAGFAVRAKHLGPLDQLPATHERIAAFIESRKLVVTGSIWESYISDAATTPAHQMVTEVNYPVSVQNN